MRLCNSRWDMKPESRQRQISTSRAEVSPIKPRAPRIGPYLLACQGMSVFRWMYSSVSTVPGSRLPSAVDEIVASSIPRNAALRVTGALVFTGVRFAQYLEGPEAAVNELMESILRDPRHRGIITLMRSAHDRRYFADWSLAYDGESRFVAGIIEYAADEASHSGENGVDRLLEMMREFLKSDRAEARPSPKGAAPDRLPKSL